MCRMSPFRRPMLGQRETTVPILDFKGLPERRLEDLPSLPAKTVLAVRNAGEWSVVVKRALTKNRRGWSIVGDVHQLATVYATTGPEATLRVYDHSVGTRTLKSDPEIYDAFVVNSDTTALGRVAAWTSEGEPEHSDSINAGILVSISPRRWRGGDCSYTSTDSVPSFAEALGCMVGELEKAKLYEIPFSWPRDT